MEIKTDSVDIKYEIGDDIGRGKFATVKRCRDRQTGSEYAAKFIRKSRGTGRRGAKMENIEKEIQILSETNHRNIINLYEVYDTKREVILILELVDGGELFEYLSEKDKLCEEEASSFVKQILEGVEHLHSQYIAHLDLKPENILLQDKNSTAVKLIDFGLSRKILPKEEHRAIMGTAEFCAPEVISFEPLSVSTDMWSIGVITYVLLSGLSPFLGDNQQETYHNITSINFEFDEEYFNGTSDLAKDFIQKLLVKDTRKRATIHQCLNHPWIKPVEKRDKVLRRSSVINTEHLKKFIARQRWKRSMKVVSLCNRLSRSMQLRRIMSSDTIGSTSEEDTDELTVTERQAGDRESAEIHIKDRESVEIQSNDRGSAEIHVSDRGSAEIHISDKESAEIYNSGKESDEIHNIHSSDIESSEIHNSERESAESQNSETESTEIQNIDKEAAGILCEAYANHPKEASCMKLLDSSDKNKLESDFQKTFGTYISGSVEIDILEVTGINEACITKTAELEHLASAETGTVQSTEGDTLGTEEIEGQPEHMEISRTSVSVLQIAEEGLCQTNERSTSDTAMTHLAVTEFPKSQMDRTALTEIDVRTDSHTGEIPDKTTGLAILGTDTFEVNELENVEQEFKQPFAICIENEGFKLASRNVIGEFDDDIGQLVNKTHEIECDSPQLTEKGLENFVVGFETPILKNTVSSETEKLGNDSNRIACNNVKQEGLNFDLEKQVGKEQNIKYGNKNETTTTESGILEELSEELECDYGNFELGVTDVDVIAHKIVKQVVDRSVGYILKGSSDKINDEASFDQTKAEISNVLKEKDRTGPAVKSGDDFSLESEHKSAAKECLKSALRGEEKPKSHLKQYDPLKLVCFEIYEESVKNENQSGKGKKYKEVKSVHFEIDSEEESQRDDKKDKPFRSLTTSRLDLGANKYSAQRQVRRTRKTRPELKVKKKANRFWEMEDCHETGRYEMFEMQVLNNSE